MVHTVNVIIFPVIDLVELYVVVMEHVTVVFVSATQDGQVNHAIVMLQVIRVLCLVVVKYVLVVALVNVVSVSAPK